MSAICDDLPKSVGMHLPGNKAENAIRPWEAHNSLDACTQNHRSTKLGPQEGRYVPSRCTRKTAEQPSIRKRHVMSTSGHGLTGGAEDDGGVLVGGTNLLPAASPVLDCMAVFSSELFIQDRGAALVGVGIG